MKRTIFQNDHYGVKINSGMRRYYEVVYKNEEGREKSKTFGSKKSAEKFAAMVAVNNDNGIVNKEDWLPKHQYIALLNCMMFRFFERNLVEPAYYCDKCDRLYYQSEAFYERFPACNMADCGGTLISIKDGKR